MKAYGLDFLRPWVWKTLLPTVPVCLLMGQLWRLNHGAHLSTLTIVFIALAGAAVVVWVIWRERGRSARVRGAQESHSKFLAAAETSLDSFSLLEAVRNDAGEIADFRLLYVNANTERLVGRSRSELRWFRRTRRWAIGALSSGSWSQQWNDTSRWCSSSSSSARIPSWSRKRYAACDSRAHRTQSV